MTLVYFHENIYYSISIDGSKTMYLCSVGDLHELVSRSNLIINSIPQYVEDPTGDRTSRFNRKHFKKIPYYEVRNVLKEYLYFDNRLGLHIHRVPLRKANEILSPFTYAQKILKNRDHISDKHLLVFLDLYDYIRMYTSIRYYEIGIEGSVLLGLHKNDSDLDILIKGRKINDIIEVFENLKSIGIIEDIPFEWIQNRRKGYHFVPNSIFKRTTNRLPTGFYKGIKIGLLGVRSYHDITLEAEILGKEVKRNVGVIEVQGKVLENSEIYFHPMIISIEPIKLKTISALEKPLLEKNKIDKIMVISFLPNYYMYPLVGKKILVRGLLQLLEDSSFRILLHFNDDYLKNRYTIYPLDF